jgi:biotin carboxylase
MPTVLFLGASVSQVAAIRQAKADGLRVIAVDGDAGAIGFPDADISEAVDFADVSGVVEIARRNHIDAVVAISSDRAVPTAAAVAEELGLPGIGIETAHVMTNKGAMRARLLEEGVPQPRFALVNSDGTSLAGVDDVGFPAVVKPVDSGGQRGVYRVHTREELLERLPEAIAHSRNGGAIVEQFVDGSELNAIVVVRGGEPFLLTLSDRLRPAGAGFGVGWVHLFPSGLDRGVLETAGAIALNAARALGLRDGIAFPQLLVTESGEVFVVEVAARIPAGQMADLVRLGIGVDLVDIALRLALGEWIPNDVVEPRFERPLAISVLTASPGVLPTGRVTSVDGLDRVQASPGVLEAGVYIQVGETIQPVQVDADRRGYVIATATDTKTALELAERASRELVVEVE